MPLEAIMNRKQLKEDGTLSDEFFIKEEFMAMLDYHVATSLSADAVQLSDAVQLRSIYLIRDEIRTCVLFTIAPRQSRRE